MTRSQVLLAGWTLLAGAGIPLIGVLNSGMTRSVGSPIGATAVMFAVAFLVALGLAIPLGGAPGLPAVLAAPTSSYGAGLLIGFYALSATILIPRFGAGNFVAFILIAQLFTAALVDQFGLLGMARRPVDAVRLAGLALIVTGVVLMQFVGQKNAAS